MEIFSLCVCVEGGREEGRDNLVRVPVLEKKEEGEKKRGENEVGKISGLTLLPAMIEEGDSRGIFSPGPKKRSSFTSLRPRCT